jgi:hypothetical protein
MPTGRANTAVAVAAQPGGRYAGSVLEMQNQSFTNKVVKGASCTQPVGCQAYLCGLVVWR